MTVENGRPEKRFTQSDMFLTKWPSLFYEDRNRLSKAIVRHPSMTCRALQPPLDHVPAGFTLVAGPVAGPRGGGSTSRLVHRSSPEVAPAVAEHFSGKGAAGNDGRG